MVLEAMKMANDLLSPVDGQIKSVLVRPGQMVLKGDLLLEFE
jgi:biotin carboxyl carrier protein